MKAKRVDFAFQFFQNYFFHLVQEGSFSHPPVSKKHEVAWAGGLIFAEFAIALVK
jgi:hypothetical protein